jgi:hypothetical protein
MINLNIQRGSDPSLKSDYLASERVLENSILNDAVGIVSVVVLNQIPSKNSIPDITTVVVIPVVREHFPRVSRLWSAALDRQLGKSAKRFAPLAFRDCLSALGWFRSWSYGFSDTRRW